MMHFPLPIAQHFSGLKRVHWQLWAAVSIMLPGSAALWASTQLFWLPDLPNCWVISWADASSATRLYCAQELGNRQTPEDLHQSIRLLNSIALEDPLRSEGDRLIEQFSQTTLRLAEAAYQDGDLNFAVNIAQKIPRGIWTYRLAERNIDHWQTTWAKAESLYQKAEEQIEKRQWYSVLTLARKLLHLDNRYWETVKYAELMRSLQLAKESSEWQVTSTHVIKPKPDALKETINKLQYSQVAQSQARLQKAKSFAQSSDPSALRNGIAEAQFVFYGTPHYEEAQALISTLQRQVETLENRPRLDRATSLASKGDPESLQAAIDEAHEITWGSALYEQANEHINEWRYQLYQTGVKARTEQLNQSEAVPNDIPRNFSGNVAENLPENASEIISESIHESLPSPIASPVQQTLTNSDRPLENNLDDPMIIEIPTPMSPSSTP
ncbi:MAG: hypothetical protein KME11_12295 [Timaviella obliquedivisa GSE-PSE-MK23-08B]|jgi:hypothetical protein|nr:hypothetical protein [Timaviella obliquedivisa GSE-PSE-MK23-08B]